jgi:hypothetical protein
MPPDSIIASADYADALLAARAAVRVFTAIVLLTLVGQMALFFTVRYRIPDDALSNANTRLAAASQPSISPPPIGPTQTELLIEYGIGLTQFFALAASLALAGSLLVTLNIMIVARVVGIAPVARALFASLPLIVLLFPWQAFLNNQQMTAADFKIPGVLYSWAELRHTAHWTDAVLSMPGTLHWARFGGFPCAALLLVITLYRWTACGLGKALSGKAGVANQAG